MDTSNFKNHALISQERKQKNIFDLPNEIVREIFKFLPYDQISKMRIVCKMFNKISSDMLNSEFNSLRNYTQKLFHSVKSQMPRRESARRKHILAKEYDIVETLNMRLTLLHMTFSKFIHRKQCCFFPGEIIDEVHRILDYIKQSSHKKTELNRAYKVTDELFDLSTMAIEYFKEFIQPNLPDSSTDYEKFFNRLLFDKNETIKDPFENDLFENDQLSFSALPPSSLDIPSTSYQRNNPNDNNNKQSLDLYITGVRLKKLEKANNRVISMIRAIKTDVEVYKRKFSEYIIQTRNHQTRIQEMNKKIAELNSIIKTNGHQQLSCSNETIIMNEASTQTTSQDQSLNELKINVKNKKRRLN